MASAGLDERAGPVVETLLGQLEDAITGAVVHRVRRGTLADADFGTSREGRGEFLGGVAFGPVVGLEQLASVRVDGRVPQVGAVCVVDYELPREAKSASG